MKIKKPIAFRANQFKNVLHGKANNNKGTNGHLWKLIVLTLSLISVSYTSGISQSFHFQSLFV